MRVLLYSTLAMLWSSVTYAEKIRHLSCQIFTHRAYFPNQDFEEQFETMMHSRGYDPVYFTWKDNSRELSKGALRLKLGEAIKITPEWWRPNTCTIVATIEQVTDHKKSQPAHSGAPLPHAFEFSTALLTKKQATLWSWKSNYAPCENTLWRALVTLPKCKRTD